MYILQLEAYDGSAVSRRPGAVRVGNQCSVAAPEGLSAWFPLDYSGFEDVSKQSAVEIGPRWSHGPCGCKLDAGAERDILIAPADASLDIGSSAAGWSMSSRNSRILGR